MLPLNVLLMIIIDVFNEKTNTLSKIWNTSGQIKVRNSFCFSHVDSFEEAKCLYLSRSRVRVT
jgi:hypothetical protein